ncbi:HalOD1 output domain-containing protein [Halorussus salinus]|uniref:HalOD1 output domain-containing protein n=1 Tax=Halorussus salinus TaxID=1364935 RepID=UPI00138EFA1E
MTEAVVRAVNTEKGSHLTDIEPLYSVVETDALNTLFSSQVSGDQRMGNGMVTFTYSGCDIRVTHDGEVLVKGSGAE